MLEVSLSCAAIPYDLFIYCSNNLNLSDLIVLTLPAPRRASWHKASSWPRRVPSEDAHRKCPVLGVGHRRVQSQCLSRRKPRQGPFSEGLWQRPFPPSQAASLSWELQLQHEMPNPRMQFTRYVCTKQGLSFSMTFQMHFSILHFHSPTYVVVCQLMIN